MCGKPRRLNKLIRVVYFGIRTQQSTLDLEVLRLEINFLVLRSFPVIAFDASRVHSGWISDGHDWPQKDAASRGTAADRWVADNCDVNLCADDLHWPIANWAWFGDGRSASKSLHFGSHAATLARDAHGTVIGSHQLRRSLPVHDGRLFVVADTFSRLLSGTGAWPHTHADSP